MSKRKRQLEVTDAQADTLKSILKSALEEQKNDAATILKRLEASSRPVSARTQKIDVC